MDEEKHHFAYSQAAPLPDKKAYGVESIIEPTLKFGTASFSGTDKLGKLCRHLKDGKLTVLDASHAPLYTVCVATRAAKSLTESKTKGLRYSKYVARPDAL